MERERFLLLDSAGMEIYVNTPAAREYAPGDLVCIVHNGVMTASIPPQIAAIEIIRQSSAVSGRSNLHTISDTKTAAFSLPVFDTRMIEQWRLPKSHAALEVGLSEGKCSLLRRAYPNGGTVGAVKAERAAGNWFVRNQMLTHSVPAARLVLPTK